MPKDNFDLPGTNDDLYFASAEDAGTDNTYYPEEDAERTEDEQNEKVIITSSYPILPDLAHWFEKEIADCDSLDNIQVDSLTLGNATYSRSISIEAQVLAYQLLKAKLTEASHRFKDVAKDLEGLGDE